MGLLQNLNLSSRLHFDDLYNQFLGLEKPQQTLVTALAGFLIFVLLALPAGCVGSKLSARADEFQQHAALAGEFMGIYEQYSQIRQQFDQGKKNAQKLGNDPLKRLLYDVGKTVGLAQTDFKQIKSLPNQDGDIFSEVSRDVVINNLSIEQSVRLISGLEASTELPLVVKKLTMKVDPKNKQQLKSLAFTLSTVMPKGGAGS